MFALVCRMLVKKPTFTIVILERDCNRMGIVRARGQDPEKCREPFILAAEILGVAAVSVGASPLKPAAPTVERATVRTDTIKRDPMLRQMRGRARFRRRLRPPLFALICNTRGLRAKLENDLVNQKAVPLLCAHDAQAQRQADTRLKNTFSL